MKMRTFAAVAALLVSTSAAALTVREETFHCPIDGEVFKQVVAMSGTSFGTHLDLKPFGPIAAPWPLPVCPTSGFVMYRANFKPEEIDRLREYVASNEYVKAREETPYYRTAKLRERMGESTAAIAYTLLRATWETRSAEQYARYAREALAAYRKALEQMTRDDKAWPTAELVAGELERRLGLFDEARARFERAKNVEVLQSGVYPRIIDFQLELIAERNTKSHQVPRGK